ncbi:class I SAM-dependent methyltransferase [Erythrobacter sp. HL-111]|uniref:class I SAM-dependent methyltransferase n=1 Tax=Erythrobacter sp. HL-111 TaxID=1798193 RepID=UPI0006DA29A3|nr:class I SAM-dependent methyltransferase [Erythrobacter sp. HL-111]KPP96597.1 MAG: Methyltransferase domain [Erythrobacteraceae bacterium HL-111]SDS02035.1 Methyltransferase domain-containing protein [Erythrobacter sp. HL-111]
MGLGEWYDAHIMPRLVTCACSQGQVMKRRAEVVPQARGDVFELGCGGGINHEFYDRGAITSYAGIDPHERLLDCARRAAQAKGWAADIRQGRGEAIPFADSAFDTVVCTFTMCSVDDPPRVLAELARVLRPGGQALFLEHGRAPDAGVAKWQDRIEPVWKRLAGGCHLTRPIGSAFRGAGFHVAPIGQGYTPQAPKFAGWMEWGAAIKPGG